MRVLFAMLVLAACSSALAQDIIPSEPQIVEATVGISPRLLNNHERRCDMVSELAEKSGLNYRLLAMKVMEKWQSSVRADKTFLKEMMQHDIVEFTVKKDGSIEIQGKDLEKRAKKGDNNKKNTTAKNTNSKTTKSTRSR